MTDTHSITELLARAGRGDESAAGQLLPRVYDELRSMASQYLAGERIDHTLQPTALVHEAYLRLAGGDRSFRSRAHFFAASATAMRRILVDHARKRRAAKRGADARRVQLTTEGAATLRQDMHVLEVNDLIEQLGKLHARKARVVELLEKIGEGGFGIVYVAEQEKPVRRRVAVKIIKLGMDTRQVVARFEAERQALALMDHPNIARVFDAGETDAGRPYFAMELVKGIPITEYCDRNKLSARDRLELFRKVCSAVQHAHQKGIIHRDIKPSNVLVTLHDGTPVPKVIDFGIAKATNQKLTEKTLYTEFRNFVGTPAYMSPEQAEMSGLDVDTRSDIYSLGVLLYELLTSTTPFDMVRLRAAGYGEMQRIIREEDPPRPSQRIATLGHTLTSVAALRRTEPARLSSLLRGDLNWITMKAMEKDRTRRYDTATDLSKDIERHLNDEPVLASPPSAVYKLRKLVRRNKGLVTAASIVAISLVVGIVATSVSLFNVSKARRAEALSLEEARTERAEADKARDVERRMRVGLAFDRGIALCEQSKVDHGLLWLARTLELLEPARDEFPDMARVIRENLSDWGNEIHPLQTVIQDEGSVLMAAFSPDGTKVLTGSHDGAARLWDASTGQRIGPPFRHNAAVGGVAFSPDGLRIVTGSDDGSAQIWNVETGKPSGPPFRHETELWTVAFSPDGRKILTGGLDKIARLWDIDRHTVITKFQGHGDRVVKVAFSPDGRTVATSSEDNTARLWNADTGEPIGKPLQHDNYVWEAVFSPDGRYILTASWDRTARLWDVATQEPLGPPFQHRAGVASAAFSPDGKQILTGTWQDNTVWLWDVDTGEQLRAFVGHEARLNAVAFSADGTRILSASDDNTARVWDVATGATDFALTRHAGPIRAVEFSPDGVHILTASDDTTVRIWDAATGKPVGEPIYRDGPVWDAAFSPDGTRILTGTEYNSARLWDRATLKPVGTPFTHRDSVSRVAFSPDGTRVITGSRDRTARIWDAVIRPLQGSVPQIRLWVETITGLELDQAGVVHVLDRQTWHERRRQLSALGGPPTP